MVLSGLCALHCIATPILIAVAPLVATHEFESGMRTLLATLAVLGVGAGTLVHRNWRAFPPLLLGVALFVGLDWSGVHGSWELVVSLIAGATLIVAHALNTLACRGYWSTSGAS